MEIGFWKKEYGEGERYQKYREILFDDKIEPLLSAAATFWVTKLDFMGITDPLKVSYKASIADNKEECAALGTLEVLSNPEIIRRSFVAKSR